MKNSVKRFLAGLIAVAMAMPLDTFPVNVYAAEETAVSTESTSEVETSEAVMSETEIPETEVSEPDQIMADPVEEDDDAAADTEAAGLDEKDPEITEELLLEAEDESPENYDLTDEAGTHTSGYWTYYYDGHSDTVDIVGYDGPREGKWTIPSSIGGYGVYSILNLNTSGDFTEIVVGDGIRFAGDFKNCPNLTSITLPDSIETLGSFKGCTSLEQITIPEKITRGVDFDGCTSLESVTFLGEVTELNSYTFRNCTSLTEFSIPQTLTRIPASMFENCTGLTEITIPGNVTSIGYGAFQGCSGLERLVLPGSVNLIHDNAFKNCTGLTFIQMSGCLVTEIPQYMCDGCTSLQYINLPTQTTKIGAQAFRDCASLRKIYLPETVNSILGFAFKGCSSLQTVEIPSGVQEVWSYSFRECTSLEYVYLPDSVTKIGGYAFDGCSSLIMIRMPENLTEIGSAAFNECSSLPAIYLPRSLTKLGTSAFQTVVNAPADHKLKDVYYGGTEEEWKAISGLNQNNTSYSHPLRFATIHYESDSSAASTDYFELNPKKVYIKPEEYVFVELVAIPDIDPETVLAWRSDNNTIATAKSNSINNLGKQGVITGVSLGTVNIYAGIEGRSAKCEVHVVDYQLSRTSLTLEKGKTGKLELKNGSNTEAATSWKSNDPSIATVNAGVVTAVSAGKTVVTATAPDGTNLSCQVTVLNEKKAVTGITVAPATATLYTGESLELTAGVLPADATNKAVTWSSSNPKIASVDESGKVTAGVSGSAKITVKSDDNPRKTAICQITVKTKMTAVALHPAQNGKVQSGKTLKITPVFNNGDAAQPTDKTLLWTSSNAAIASVNQSGVVAAKSAGTVTITAVCAADRTVRNTCSVTVYDPVTAITLNSKSVSLGTGDSYTLTATVTPATASDLGTTFTSSDDSIVSVTQNNNTAVLKAADTLPAGSAKATAKITVTANDGSGKNAVCTVTVGTKVSKLTITAAKEQKTLAVGKTLKLTATTEPKNAANKEIKWSSSNEGVATVDANKGVVTALTPGDVVITATNEASGVSATYPVSTYIPISKITLNATSLNLHEGISYQLATVITPADATLRNESNEIKQAAGSLTYSIKSGLEYVSLTAGGKITAKPLPENMKSAKAMIVASVKSDGGIEKSATCTVTVVKQQVLVNNIKLNKTKLDMGKGTSATLTATVLPDSADQKDIVWSSDDDTVAFVNETSGEVTAIGPGSTKIYATATDGSGKKAACNVTVGNPANGIAIANKATLPVTLAVGKSISLKATVTAANGKPANAKASWKSNQPAVATVDQNGKVTAKSVGHVTITAEAENGSKDSFELDTYIPVTKIVASRTTHSLYEGGTGNIWITSFTPLSATNKEISWSSSNPEVVSLAVSVTDGSEKLTYTALKPGTAKITGTTTDGSKKTVTLNVKVYGHVKEDDVKIKIKSNPAGSVITPGTDETKAVVITKVPVRGKITLLPMVTAGVADQSVLFTCDAPNVVSLTAKGVITANHPGTAVITMITADGGYEATCTVTVE